MVIFHRLIVQTTTELQLSTILRSSVAQNTTTNKNAARPLSILVFRGKSNGTNHLLNCKQTQMDLFEHLSLFERVADLRDFIHQKQGQYQV
jgi:hypothetical protein